MGYKLGKAYKPYMTNGSLRTKLRFGGEAGETSIPGTPIIRKPLDAGIMGEANMDGSIYVSNKIKPGSEEDRKVINHEMRHATDMRVGKLEYGDDYIKYNGETFKRQTINGRDMILFEGEWKEAGAHGENGFPWENEANNM